MSKKTFYQGVAVAIVLGILTGTTVAYIMVKPDQSWEATDE
jgi:hypothetical protein